MNRREMLLILPAGGHGGFWGGKDRITSQKIRTWGKKNSLEKKVPSRSVRVYSAQEKAGSRAAGAYTESRKKLVENAGHKMTGGEKPSGFRLHPATADGLGRGGDI